MGNAYEGTKFLTEFQCRKPLNTALFNTIKQWAQIFAENEFAPALDGGFGGNLSIRDDATFIITASGADMGNLKPEEIVRVCSIDLESNKVTASGSCLPSSESMLHAEIYRNYPTVNAVFHGHYPPFEHNAEKLGLIITARETPYGSKELIDETLKIINDQKVVILKNHGFVSIAQNPDKAGEQVLELFKKLL